MFDKEAEEYAIDNYENCLYDDFPYTNDSRAREQSFKDGANFGYNKANEWHNVKDGLPKTSGRYLVYTGGEPFIHDFDTEVNSFGYWVVLLGDDWGVQDEDFETVKDRGEDNVIAWKEIILPELPK